MSTFVFSLRTDLHRYARSRGIWLVMLIAPIAARFWVPHDDGSAMAISVGGHLPEPSSAVIGLSLGAVCVTAFLPVVWGYLRVNVTRQQPWQIADVTAASRVMLALGRFAADATVMVGLLVALTLAGWILALFSLGAVQPLMLAGPLWLIALPPLLCAAGMHRLFDGLPLLRRAPGDLLFFIAWMTMLVVPLVANTSKIGMAGALSDGAGIVRPLSGGSEQHPPLAIGIIPVRAGRVPIDIPAGVRSDGYLASRLIWASIGFGFAALAGLCYRSPRGASQLKKTLRPIGSAISTVDTAPPSPQSSKVWLVLMTAEMAALLGGKRTRWFALAAAAVGCVGDYRHVGSPIALLLLAFGLAAHTGRWTSKGLMPLTVTMPVSMFARGTATIAAATAWGLLLALPAAVSQFDLVPLEFGVATSLLAGAIASVIAATTRSGTVPRLVLLIFWYGYFSS